MGFDTSGVMRLKPSTHTAPIPQTPEQLRTRHKVAAHSWTFASYKASACKWLKGFNVRVYTDLSDYILGEHVMGLEARDASNQVVGRAPWALVLSYCVQVEKRAYKFVMQGESLVVAMRKAMECGTTKERFFTTPLSVSPKTLEQDGQARVNDSWQMKSWSPKGFERRGILAGPAASLEGRQQRWRKGNNKKGTKKGGGKTQRAPALARTTPDGRPICFAFNGKGCTGPPGCDRVHVCRSCFGDHPMSQCPA